MCSFVKKHDACSLINVISLLLETHNSEVAANAQESPFDSA